MSVIYTFNPFPFLVGPRLVTRFERLSRRISLAGLLSNHQATDAISQGRRGCWWEREREWGLSSQSRAKIMMFTTWWCWRLYITSCSSASALLWQSKDLTQPRPKEKTTMTSRPFCPNALRQSQGGWQGGSQQLQGAVNLKDSIECLAVCSYLTWVTMVFEWCQKGNLFRTDSKIGSNSWIQLNPIQENFSCLMWNPFLGLQVFEQAHVTLESRWDSGCHISLVRGKPLQNDPSVRYNDIAFATVFVQCQYQYHHVKSFKLDWISRFPDGDSRAGCVLTGAKITRLV